MLSFGTCAQDRARESKVCRGFFEGRKPGGETVLHSHPNGSQKPKRAPQRLKHEGLLSPCGADLRFLLGESHTLIEMGSCVNGTCACCRTTSAGLCQDSLGAGSRPLVESRAFDPCFGFHILLDFSSLVMTAAPRSLCGRTIRPHKTPRPLREVRVLFPAAARAYRTRRRARRWLGTSRFSLAPASPLHLRVRAPREVFGAAR